MSLARFHVMPQDGYWHVVRVGAVFKGPYSTRDEAIHAARIMALLIEPAQILVHDPAGGEEIETCHGAQGPSL